MYLWQFYQRVFVKFIVSIRLCFANAHLLCFGLFSFSLSSSYAMLNYLAACLIAGLPSSKIPLGSLPSGDMFLIFRIISYSSLSVLNILLMVETDLIFFFITLILAFLSFSLSCVASICICPLISSMFLSSSSSKLEHFFTIVNSMLDTLSARKGKDHEKTFSPSGSL